LLPLGGLPEETQKQAVLKAWYEVDRHQRFVWNKLITGAFRVGVSQQLVTRALAAISGLEMAVIAQRLMGDWAPTPAFYEQLRATVADEVQISRPYPFFLAHLREGAAADMGDLADWQAEWKWDGIRPSSSVAPAKRFSGRAARNSSPSAIPR
jgi:DNA ligase-1